MSAPRFMRWLGVKKRDRGGPKPRVTSEMFAEAVGVNVTTARRWLRGAATPDRKFVRRIHVLQKETKATFQQELFNDRDDAMEQTARREAAIRHVEARLKREREQATRPLAMPVEDEAEQDGFF